MGFCSSPMSMHVRALNLNLHAGENILWPTRYSSLPFWWYQTRSRIVTFPPVNKDKHSPSAVQEHRSMAFALLPLVQVVTRLIVSQSIPGIFISRQLNCLN